MEKRSHKRSLTVKVGLLYFFMNVISISLFTWIISNNQVELITDNTRFQAKELMSSVVQNLRNAPAQPNQATRLTELSVTLARLVPNFMIYAGDSIWKSSSPGTPLPSNHLENALKASALREQAGLDYHVVLEESHNVLEFYIPAKDFGLGNATIYTTLSLKEIGRRFADLYKLIAITVVSLTALHALFGFLIFRLVITPILRLQEATRKIAAGNFEHKVQINRYDEVGALAEGFNYMMNVIQETLEHIRRMAVTDELTGLYNRRHFFDRMEQMVASAGRYNQCLGLIILDIDNFKLVNDTYGHLAGDQVLREIADCLRQESRKADILARYGGEELVLVLPETDLPGSVHTAEKIRQSLEAREIRLDDGRTLHITASFGVAEFSALSTLSPGTPINTEKIVEAADVALYRAKNSGRNRVDFA